MSGKDTQLLPIPVTFPKINNVSENVAGDKSNTFGTVPFH
jgi:hypothetical protein